LAQVPVFDAHARTVLIDFRNLDKISVVEEASKKEIKSGVVRKARVDISTHRGIIEGKIAERNAYGNRVITSVSFSPDGRLLAFAAEDCAARISIVKSPNVLKTFLEHPDGVNSVAFSPDGDWWASGAMDGRIIYAMRRCKD